MWKIVILEFRFVQFMDTKSPSLQLKQKYRKEVNNVTRVRNLDDSEVGMTSHVTSNAKSKLMDTMSRLLDDAVETYAHC